MQVLYDAGYTDIGRARAPGEYTYQFDGRVGSLDHVLANRPALAEVTGAHVWNINSVESVAYEYSRHNSNATDFYAPDPFRSSDHDPLLVGFDVPAPPAATTTSVAVDPRPVVVRDTRPTVTATVASDAGPVDAGTVTFSSGGTVLGTAPVSGGTASLRLAAYDAVGTRSVTAAYSGSRSVAASTGSVTFDVVRATPTMTVGVQPSVIHKKTTRPRLDVALAATGQVVGGTVVVRQDGAVLGVEQLVGGRATVVLPPYKQKGTEKVTVQYLGSDVAEPVSRKVTITVQN